MPRPTVILGDQLAVLTPLAAYIEREAGEHPPGASPSPSSARAAVIGLDLRDATSLREVKRRLRDITDRAARDVRGYPDLVHLFVVFLVPAAVRADRLSSATAGIASRLHAALERERGQYVDVALINATGCGDSLRLTARIADRVRERAGMHTDIALDWQEIRDRSISDIALDEYT